MAKHKSAPTGHAKPWQRLDHLDALVIDDVEYRIKSSDKHGQLLYETSRPAVTAFYDHVHWENVRTSPGFKHIRGAHDPNKPDIKKLAGVEFAGDIPAHQLMRMHYLEVLIIELITLHQSEQTSLDKDEVQKLIDGEMGHNARMKLKKRQFGAKIKGGGTWIDFDITATILLKKRRDYIKHGFAALRDGRYRSGNKLERLHPDVGAILALKVAESIGNPSATAVSVLDDVQDEIDVIHEKLALLALSGTDEEFEQAEKFKAPDIKTVRKAMKERDKFALAIGRFGLDIAVQMHPAVRGKPDYLGPLDRVEYDESLVDALTFLSETGIWAFLTEEEKKSIKRGRLVIAIAICVATRCIVGMRIYEVGNGEEAVATFQMIHEDKTKYIPLELRDKVSWHQHGGVGSIVMDQGSSNISDEARTCLANLEVPVVYAPAAMPTARGTGERIFLTCATRIYSLLDARTGANVVDRDNYKPETRASLTTDELWKVLVLGVVGIYHNTPHQELNGRTPAEEWDRMIPDYGVNALPDPNRRRVSFGRRLRRKVTKYGVDFAGQSYTNPLIDYHWLHSGGELQIAADPEDLGAISVQFGDSWFEALNTDPDMRGVGMMTLFEAAAPLTDLKSDDARKRRAARRAVKQAIRDIQENARGREDKRPTVVTDEMIRQGEERIFGKYQHADTDQPVKKGQLGIAVQPDNRDLSESRSGLADEATPAPKTKKSTKSTSWKMKP